MRVLSDMRYGRRLLLLVGLLICPLASQATDCPPLAERADSLDFGELHRDCAEQPEDKKESNSKSSTAPQSSQSESIPTPSSGEAHTAAANFQLAAGPAAAERQLQQSMAETCPEGWRKLAEWTVAVTRGYRLYYRFQCH